jgi:hypothetical protein
MDHKMALIVGYENSSLDRYDVYLYVGEGRIKENISDIFGVEAHLMVQADGHELELIKRQFTNIPMTANRVVRWQGDDAKFIINNINLTKLN